MCKRICSFVLVFVLCLIPMQATAANPDMPSRIEAYLIADSGEVMSVIGQKVDLSQEISELSASSSSEESSTYVFSLYSNPSYTLTANEMDGSLSVRVYLTIKYTTRNSPAEYLLTNVSGSWEILDSRVSITKAELEYGCTGFYPSYAEQSGSKEVSNNFSYDTGFTKYIIPEGGVLGSYLTLDLLMGQTRQWDFVIKNYLFD